MWLTGFDVKSLSTLYLDKPMKGHTLMQAIARANRVFPGKTCGIVIDYVNVFKFMREALSDACYAMFNFLKTKNGGYEEMAKALDKAKSALAIPPRNCDRPECATTKAAQEIWRKADGGKTAYYEWLLAASTK